MRKMVAVLSLAAVAALGLAGVASAHMWGNDDGGPGYGMGPGMMYGYGAGSTVSVEKFKQFQRETSSLRDELAVKQVDLQSEFAKEKPDTDRIAALQKEIIDLRTRIGKAADKAGIDADRGTGRGRGYGHRGNGMMYGSGYGCAW